MQAAQTQLLVIVFRPSLCSCFSGHMTEEVRTPRHSLQVRMALFLCRVRVLN
jgi:hypothetical protein